MDIEQQNKYFQDIENIDSSNDFNLSADDSATPAPPVEPKEDPKPTGAELESSASPTEDPSSTPASDTPESSTDFTPKDLPEGLDALIESVSESEESSETQKPQETPTTSTPKSRDLTFLPPDLQRFGRQMSNEAFSVFERAFKDKIALEEQRQALEKQNQEAQERLNHYKSAFVPSDAEAYQLHPAFHNLTKAEQQLNNEKNYWVNALAKVRAGESYNRLAVDAQGNVVIDQTPVEPSPQEEAFLLERMAEAQQLIKETQSDREKFKQSFQSAISEHNEFIQKAENLLFSKFRPQEAAMNYVLEQVPEVIRNRPEIRFAAKSYAALTSMHEIINKLMAQLKQQKTAAAAANSQGPSDGSPGPTPSFDPKTFAAEIDRMGTEDSW